MPISLDYYSCLLFHAVAKKMHEYVVYTNILISAIACCFLGWLKTQADLNNCGINTMMCAVIGIYWLYLVNKGLPHVIN